MPDVPPPSSARRFATPLPEGVIGLPARLVLGAGRIAARPSGTRPWDDWEPTGSERAYWYRFDEPPVDDDGRWDPLSLVTLCDTMPGAVGERMGPQSTHGTGPAPISPCTSSAPATSGGCSATAAPATPGSGYASLEMELWDPAQRPRRIRHADGVLHLRRRATPGRAVASAADSAGVADGAVTGSVGHATAGQTSTVPVSDRRSTAFDVLLDEVEDDVAGLAHLRWPAR